MIQTFMDHPISERTPATAHHPQSDRHALTEHAVAISDANYSARSIVLLYPPVFMSQNALYPLYSGLLCFMSIILCLYLS